MIKLRSSKYIILVFSFIFSVFQLNAEGTKSIWKTYTGLGTGNESGGLLVNYISDPVNGSYPAYTFNSTSDERMYVHIKDFNTESIKFGFNVRRVWFTDCNSVPNANGDYTSGRTGGRRVHWRLKNPSGVVVATSGASGIPYWNGGVTTSTTAGFIGTYNEAINGPDGFNGIGNSGYTPISHTPTMNGDYYFEFNYGSNTTMFDNSGCSWATMEFNYFDISVTKGTNTIDGRLWSRQWSLLTVNRAPNAGTFALSENSSKFHIYTTDSIITKIELDRVVPGYFNVIANENGIGTTGNFANDSKSTSSPAVALNRLNKIFLNTPDTTIYPARALTRSVSPVYVQRCSQNDQCIIVDLNRESSATLYLEINGTPGFQPSTSDRLIRTSNLPRGANCVPWDGRDGSGNFVPDGDTIFIQVLFESNVTQVPLQDIESNPNGLKISLELPISGSTAVYWDDSNVGGSTNLTGCVGSPTTGCHSWTGNFSSGIGNGNVINSYWYSTLDTLVTIPIIDSTFAINILNTTEDATCNPTVRVDPGTINLVNFAGNPNVNFRWSTTGTGTFLPHDSTLFADYQPSARDIEFGGIVKLYLTPRVGCPEVVDSILIDLGNRPGGVSSNLLGWYKANEEVRNSSNNIAASGQNVSTWRNRAQFGNDATAVVLGPVYTENVFNSNPGLVFSDQDNQRLTLPVDFGTAISGNGTYLSANSNSIINGSNANGPADGNFALVDNNTDRLVLDLGQILPTGTSYRIIWRRKSSYPFGATADMEVQESLAAGSGYATNPITPKTGSITSFVTTTLVTQSPTRYLRLYPLTGTNDDFEIDAVSYATPARQSETVFIVAKKSNNTANTYASAGSKNNFRTFFGDASNNPRFRFDGTGTTINASPAIPNNEAFVSAYQINLTGNEKVVYNGVTSYNTNFGAIDPVTSFILGNNSTNSGELAGAIGEFIIYGDALSDAEIQRIESYLAIKYGITLNRNYLNSNGSVIFTADGTGANVFDNDIAGLGAEVCAVDLRQEKSISQNTDAVVQMSNASSLQDDEYLLWGNDNGSLVTKNTTDVNSRQFTERLTRVWKAQATGDMGTVRVAFYLGNVTAAPTDIKKYGLMKGATPTMANATLTSYVKYISNDTLYFEGVSFSGVNYFTVATEIVDYDNDGVADVNDLDTDNDGIPDVKETLDGSDPYADANNDGLPNYVDPTYVNCGGIVNGVCRNFDADGDGKPNFLDLDADNDGIQDILEAGGVDTDKNGLVDSNIDTDFNGLMDIVDPSNGGTALPVYNTDSDVLSDHLDRDSDNDGFTDAFEAGGADINHDGIIDGFFDSNGNGWNDAQETTQLPLTDTDGDNAPNYRDKDSDGDGITDALESGGTDINGDGEIDGFVDDDNDGLNNLNEGTAPTTPNKDGDSFPDYLDLDSDNDGIADVIEAGGVDANNDGKQDGVDADLDGLSDAVDTDNGGTKLSIADFDGDGLPNYLDIDSDNDGLIDNVEGQSTSAFLAPLGVDTDGDGWDNRYDSDNGGTTISLNNQESAGNPDYLDLDTDGDGQPDWIEGFDDDQSGLANSGDALNDFLIRASNFEAAGGNSNYYNNSLDGDGVGIPNWLEDSDLDGQPNFIDADSPFYRDTDNDGLIDLYDTDNFGVESSYPDRDGDLEPDWRDTDNVTTLPITLLSFDAEKKIDVVFLSWTTLSEINNDYFTIEKTKDGKNYSEVGKVKGAGNANEQLDYRLIDETPYNGLSYYRLKQTDFNGDFSYSELRAVEFNLPNLLEESNVYPNPTNGEQLFFRLYSKEKGELELSIRTMDGQLINTRLIILDGYETNYEVELLKGISLSKGTYMISYRLNERFLGSKRFVVK